MLEPQGHEDKTRRTRQGRHLVHASLPYAIAISRPRNSRTVSPCAYQAPETQTHTSTHPDQDPHPQ